MWACTPPASSGTRNSCDCLERDHHNFIHHAAPLPWARTGPGQALDGKPKFDLTQFDPDTLDRLRSRVRAAGERGIYVSHARRVADQLNLAAMRPRSEFASTGYCLANPGTEYLVYQPKGDVAFTLTLQPGTYDYEWISATQGSSTGSGRLEAPDGVQEFKAPFAADAVLHLKIVNPGRGP